MVSPIPDIPMPAISCKYSFVDSPLLNVEIESQIDVRMMYVEWEMKHATSKCLVRKEVLDKLKEVQRLLPDGLYLRVWDAWRPFELQKELFEAYSKTIIKRFNLSELPNSKRIEFISKYVSVPHFNKEKAPVHTTGGAVDLTLVDANGNELNMGTEFDSFSEKTHTAYFESTDEEEIKINRRILYNAMTSVGFTNLPSEWWHYDYGDGFWSYYTDIPTKYTGIRDIKEVDSFE
jgi:D-alanyl-D-alanine dipeptidase